MAKLKSLTIDGTKFDLTSKTSTIVKFGYVMNRSSNAGTFDFLKLNSGQNLLNYIQNNHESGFENLGWELVTEGNPGNYVYSFVARNDGNSYWQRIGIWDVLAAALGIISEEDFFSIDQNSYIPEDGLFYSGIKIVPYNDSDYNRISKVGEIISLEISTATSASHYAGESSSFKVNKWYKGRNEETLQEFLTQSSLYTSGQANYVLVSFEVEKLL
jgi:hypothetical protein